MSDITSIQYEQALLADFESMLAPEHDDATNEVIDLLPLTGSYDRDLVSMVSEQAPAPAAPAQELTLNGQPWSEYKQLLLDAYVFSHFEGRSMEEDLTGLLYVEYALKQAEIEHVEWLERPARETQDAPDYRRAMLTLDLELHSSEHLYQEHLELCADKRLQAVVYSIYFENRSLLKVIASHDACYDSAKGFYNDVFPWLSVKVSSPYQSFRDGWLSPESFYSEVKSCAYQVFAVHMHFVMQELVPFKTKKAVEKHAAQLTGAARDVYEACKAGLRMLKETGRDPAINPKWYA